jgi:sulfur-carrier protein
MITVLIPHSLRRFANNERTLKIPSAATVDELYRIVVRDYPLLRERIFNASGNVNSFINTFVDGKNIRHLDGIKTPLQSSSEVTVVAAIAGG